MMDALGNRINTEAMPDVGLEVDVFPTHHKNRHCQQLLINGICAPLLILSFGLLLLGVIWQEKESMVTKEVISGFSILGIGSSTLTLLWNNYPRKRPL